MSLVFDAEIVHVAELCLWLPQPSAVVAAVGA